MAALAQSYGCGDWQGDQSANQAGLWIFGQSYKPGDRIFLLGFSRGAYAARSLAGMIDMVGLLTQDQATVRNIRQIYRHYECDPNSKPAQEFCAGRCHKDVEIEMVGVWDTVRTLGLRWPIIWRFLKSKNEFHNHHLGHSIRHGFQALAMDETRVAFSPVMWDCPADWQGMMQQVWFKGCHSDIGGYLGGYDLARPLSNIPLVWMLQKMQGSGVEMPADYLARFVIDIDAPAVGSFRGWSMLFLWRKKRIIGCGKSESIHSSVDLKMDSAEITLRQSG